MDVKHRTDMMPVRIAFFLIGLILISFGISVSIISNFGVGGWDAFNIGLKYHFGFTIGTWMNVCAACFILMGGILRQERPRFETFITSIVIGISVDVWMMIFKPLQIHDITYQFLVFMSAIVIISVGAGIYLVSELPPNPIDYFMLSLCQRFHISITKAKICSESLGLLLGFLSGGPIGLGSVIMILCFGPAIDFCFRIAERYYIMLTKKRQLHND